MLAAFCGCYGFQHASEPTNLLRIRQQLPAVENKEQKQMKKKPQLQCKKKICRIQNSFHVKEL